MPDAPAKPAVDPAEYEIEQTPQAPREVPPRDPQTGQFVKQESEQPAPVKPTHPSYLADMARDFGLSDEEINEVDTQTLGMMVRRFRAQERRQQAENSRQSALIGQPQQVQQPALPSQPEAPIDVGLSEEQFGPELIGALRNIKGTSAKELKALREQLDRIESSHRQRVVSENAQHLDRAFEVLGSEYAHIFGTGPAIDLQHDDPAALQRRISTVQALIANKVNPSALSAKGMAAKLKAEADKIFKVAAPPADPYKQAEPAPAKGNGAQRFTPEQWAEGGAAKPTQRGNANEPKGDALAKKNLAKKLNDRGYSPVTPEELEGIPD